MIVKKAALVPLDKYSAFLADLIRQLASNDKILEETKNKILGIRLEENGSTGTVMLDTLSKKYETLS